MTENMRRRKHSATLCTVLIVLLLASQAVHGADAQLWDKLPFVSRFSKAAQAAKAAASAITVSTNAPKTPSLPPAPATPVLASLTITTSPPAAPAGSSDATQQQQGKAGEGKKWGKKKKKQEAQKPSLTGKNDTQAGCSCLSQWEVKPGGPTLSGCANPDNDPLGAWCVVDPNECMGYYSMYRTDKGKLRFYDYCVPVRERTKRGCLCSGDWSGDGGVGKSIYRDGCARPHAAEGARVCKVDSATCPPGVDVGEYDECHDRPEQIITPQEKTWHNCGCVQGWSYKYEDGTTAEFSTCANPDLDPLGPWCEVDPMKCDSFATVLKNGDKKMSIDYCQSKFPQLEPTGCNTRLKLHDQCGGKSNCTSSGCVNAPWPGACCPQGSECRKQDAFFYQCQPLDAELTVKSYKTAPGGAPKPPPAPPSTPKTLPPATPKKSAPKAPSPPEIIAEIAPGALEDAPASTADAGTKGEAGARVWVKLRLGMDYDLLMAQPQRLGLFKADLAQWLRELVAETKYIHDTGVDDVVPGSVIAYGYIDFAEGTPQEVVDAAMEQLHTTGQNMYADSKLPSKWGWLLNYSTGLNKSTLMEDTAGDVQIESLAFPSAATQKAKHNRMSVTATVAVVVAVAAVICAIVCIIILMKRKGAKVASAPVKDQKPKEAQESGNGGTSDYLRDLDGMDDGASERTKFSFARSSVFAGATFQRMSQGMRGVMTTVGKSRLGEPASSGGRKQGSEAGIGNATSSRLWNWLQKAEAAVDADADMSGRRTCNTHPTTITPAHAKDAAKHGNLPTPHAITPMPLPALDLSDPGGGCRVPPPSPRCTDRASSFGPSSEQTAAGAISAAMGGPTAGIERVMSPRPAPAHASLTSHFSSKSSSHSGSSGRRGVRPFPSQTRAPQVSSPRTHHGPQLDRGLNGPPGSYNNVDSLPPAGGSSYPAAADDYAALPHSYGRSSGSQIPMQPAPYGTRGPSTRLPEDPSDLPPGLSMGPFLRAAIKSLTGQSLEASPYPSDGGAAGGDPSAGAGGYSGASYNPSYNPSSSTGPQAGKLTSNRAQGAVSSHQKLGPTPSFTPSATSNQSSFHIDRDLMPPAMRMQQHEARRQGMPEKEGPLEGSGSMFQSLWMQRLVAAAHAQQSIYGEQNM